MKKLPNILYIMSDQHTASVMGCAGDIAAQTPNLDRLSQSGIRFTRAYCPSPVCLPSRMSMLTGLRPHEQKCWTNDDILDSSRPTWLHGLGASGYSPVLVGRMHSLGPDQLRGYADRIIGDHSPAWPGVARRSLGALARTSSPFIESIKLSGPGQNSYQLMDDAVLEASVNFLKNHAASKSDEPFCLTASFMLPHPPYVASQEDYDQVKDKVSSPRIPIPAKDEHPWIKKWRLVKTLNEVSSKDIHRARCSYYALVRQLDRAVGVLLDTLKKIGEMENTLIVYVSDHGDHLGERGLFWKHTLYEEAIKVPLILSWPGKIEPGKICSDPIETGGLGNTILSLVGAAELPNSSMRSFSNLVFGQSNTKSEAPIFIEYCTDDLTAWSEKVAVQQIAIIKNHYKLIYYNNYPTQLFNLLDDPFETNDLADNNNYIAIRDQLKKLILAKWSPDKIAHEIKLRKDDKLLLKKWAEASSPPDLYRWQILENQNYLEGTIS